MEELTPDEFDRWANDYVTVAVRNHVLKKRQEHSTLDDNPTFNRNKFADGLKPLEAIGLVTAMSLSVVTGTEYFTDFDILRAELFEGWDNET